MCLALSFTTNAAPRSSIDHGGGKRLPFITVVRGRGSFRDKFGRANSILLTHPTRSTDRRQIPDRPGGRKRRNVRQFRLAKWAVRRECCLSLRLNPVRVWQQLSPICRLVPPRFSYLVAAPCRPAFDKTLHALGIRLRDAWAHRRNASQKSRPAIQRAPEVRVRPPRSLLV